MLPDSKLYFLRQSIFASLKRVTRNPSAPIFSGSFDAALLCPWLSDITFVAYPKSGLKQLARTILAAAESHTTATTNFATSYSQLRRQFPFLPQLRFTHAGSSWRNRLLDKTDMLNYSPGEWVSGNKIIYIHRNPRDVLVETVGSLQTDFELRDLKPGDVIANGIVGVHKIARFGNRWQGWCSGNANCLSISYEDLQKDPVGQIRVISEFCGFGFSSNTIGIACDAAAPEPAPNAGNETARPDPWSVPRTWAGGGKPPSAASFQELFSADEIARIEEIIMHEVGYTSRTN